MGMYSGVIRAWQRHITLVAGLFLLAPACTEPAASATAESLGLPQIERPSAATQGAPRAFLGAVAGTLSIAAANGETIESHAGTPLLADDRLTLGDGGLAVVIYTNGNVLRIEGPLDQELRTLAGFDSPPPNGDLETQLVAALSDADRTRLSAENERIGGWQLRVTALEAPAPESEERSEDASKGAPRTPSADEPPRRMDTPFVAGMGGLGDVTATRTSEADGEKDDKDAGDGALSQGRIKKTVHEPKLEKKPASPSGISSGTASKTTGTADTASWSLKSAKWATSGSKVRIPTTITKKIASCLPEAKGSGTRQVDLLLEFGVIRKVTIKGGPPCDPKIIGTHIDGVDQSGSVHLTFKPKKAP